VFFKRAKTGEFDFIVFLNDCGVFDKSHDPQQGCILISVLSPNLFVGKEVLTQLTILS
jgi:hypothetical protein